MNITLERNKLFNGSRMNYKFSFFFYLFLTNQTRKQIPSGLVEKILNQNLYFDIGSSEQ